MLTNTKMLFEADVYKLFGTVKISLKPTFSVKTFKLPSKITKLSLGL